jgi:hypothetical protein
MLAELLIAVLRTDEFGDDEKGFRSSRRFERMELGVVAHHFLPIAKDRQCIDVILCFQNQRKVGQGAKVRVNRAAVRDGSGGG